MHLICNCQEALVVPFDPSPFTPGATEHRRIPGQMISEWQRRRGQIQAACLLASNWEKASRSTGYRCKCQQKSVLLLKFIIDFFVWIARASVPSHCFCKRSLCPENGWYDQRFCNSVVDFFGNYRPDLDCQSWNVLDKNIQNPNRIQKSP